MVVDELQFSVKQFSDVISTCDPSIAKLGEGFLDHKLSEHFEEDMLQLLEDARNAWMSVKFLWRPLYSYFNRFDLQLLTI
jgi:hypothetical protein